MPCPGLASQGATQDKDHSSLRPRSLTSPALCSNDLVRTHRSLEEGREGGRLGDRPKVPQPLKGQGSETGAWLGRGLPGTFQRLAPKVLPALLSSRVIGLVRYGSQTEPQAWPLPGTTDQPVSLLLTPSQLLGPISASESRRISGWKPGAPIRQPAHPSPRLPGSVCASVCECRVQRGKEVTKWVLTLQMHVSGSLQGPFPPRSWAELTAGRGLQAACSISPASWSCCPARCLPGSDLGMS